MDVHDFLFNGVLKPNPNYSKSSAKKGEPPYLISNDPSEQNSLGESLGKRMARESWVINDVEDIDSYTKKGITINPINSTEELKRARAEKQAWYDQLGNALVQGVVGEGILGIAEGFTNMLDFAINLSMGKTPFNEENDYTNPASSAIEDWKEQIRQAFPIYKLDEGEAVFQGTSQGMLDFGWWASNAPNVMSSLALLVPARAGTFVLGKGFGLLNKLGKAGKAISLGTRAERQVNRASRLGKMWTALGTEGTLANAIANTASTAGFSRLLENYQESAQVYKDVNDLATKHFNAKEFDQELFIKDNTDKDGNFKYASSVDENGNVNWDKVAKTIANEAANEDFKDNLANFFFDFLQVYALRNFVKGFKDKVAGRDIRIENKAAAQGFGKSAAELASQNSSSNKIINNLLNRVDAGKTVLAAEASEGVEEMVNYVAQEEGMHLGNVLLGDEVDNSFDTRFGQYLRDGQFWDSAFWGVLGGVVFQGLGSGFNRVVNRVMKNHQISETEGRKLEIAGRQESLNDLIKRTKLIDDGFDIYNPKPQDGTKKDSTKPEDLYNKFDEENGSIEEQQIRAKQRLTDEVLTKMIVNAAMEGNLGLLRDYLNDENIQKQLGIKNVDNAKDIDSWNRYVTEKIDKVENKMDDVLGYLSKLQVPAQYARMIAVDNVFTQLQTETLESEIAAVNSEIDRNLDSGRIGINKEDAYAYRSGIKAQVLAKQLRQLKEKRAELEKMKTISSRIGIRNIDRQISALEAVIDEEFLDYVNYQSLNFGDRRAATEYRNNRIDELQLGKDEKLSEAERKNLAALDFDKSVTVTAYANLYSQDQGLAKLYNDLAILEIANEVSKNDAKLTDAKVDEIVHEYDNTFNRAKNKAADKAADIITKMFDKYNEDEVYQYIENSENTINGIDKKDKKSLDDALLALDLLNPDNTRYLNAIQALYARSKAVKAQAKVNHGENPDPGEPNTKYKVNDKVLYNNEEFTINSVNPNGTYNIRKDTTFNMDVPESELSEIPTGPAEEGLPFAAGNQGKEENKGNQGGEENKVLKAQRKVLNYFSVNTPTKEYSYDQIQPGDIITYGREGEPSTETVVVNVISNPSGRIDTIEVLNLNETDKYSPFEYKVTPILPDKVRTTPTRDERVEERKQQVEKEKQEILNAPETVAAKIAYDAFVNTPTNSGLFNWEAIRDKTYQELARRGIDDNNAKALTVEALTNLRNRYGDTATMKSDIAEILVVPYKTPIYSERVKKFIDRYLEETHQGVKEGRKRYINIQALFRYAKTHGVESSQIAAVYMNLKNHLLSTDTYVVTDDYASLNAADFLAKTDMTVEQVNELEEVNAISQRVDIATIINQVGEKEFNEEWSKLKPGDKLNYSVEGNDLFILSPNGKKIGRLPIIRLKNGTYNQINDGWNTDIKPVNREVKSKFIDWLKEYISDPDSELFKLVREWGISTDEERKAIAAQVVKTEGWKRAKRRKLMATDDLNVLMNGLFKLWRFNNNSNDKAEYITNYDSWARKLLNSYSSIDRFVSGTNAATGSIVINYITEGQRIEVPLNEADVPSKTIANLDTKVNKLASFYSDRNNPSTGVFISGQKEPYTGNLAFALSSGRSFITINNRSGSPTFIQTVPIAVDDIQSEEGKKLVAAVKNKLFILIDNFVKNNTDESFKELCDFANEVFSTCDHEASLFYAKDAGQHRGIVDSRAVNIDLGKNNRFRIYRRSNEGTKTSIFIVGDRQYKLDNRQDIKDGINAIFSNLTIHTEHNYVKIDGQTDPKVRRTNGIVSWFGGKFNIHLEATYNGKKRILYDNSFDSYSDFMISNDLLKARTKIENGSNFRNPEVKTDKDKLLPSASLKVKLINGDVESARNVELPSTDISDRVRKAFTGNAENKSKAIIRIIFNKNKALNELLDLPIFSENINFVDENIGAYGHTVIDSIFTIGDRTFNKGDIVFGREWLDKLSKDPSSAGADIIHENIHKHLINPENRSVLRNIYRIYDEFLDSLQNEDNLRKFAKEIGVSIEDVRTWRDNVIRGITGHDTQDQDVEEFLVQSLTSRSIINYLNVVDASDYNKDDTNKSLWQKILELVQKLFGLEVREGSLREKEYYALSDFFKDDYTPKDRTKKETSSEPTSETPKTSTPPSPLRRTGPMPRRTMRSDIREIDVQVINVDTYLANFRSDLQPELSRLLNSGSLNLKC